MAAIEADPRLVLQTTEGPFMYLTFNGRAGPLADKRVRQAIGHAIKRDEVVKAAFFGRGKPLDGVPINPGGPFFDNALSIGQRYNPARAKKLLAEAGHPDGFSTSLLSTAQYGMHKDTAAVIQQNLAAVGIQAELRLPDWSTRVAQGNRGQYEIGLMGSSAESNDPDGVTNLVDSSLPIAYTRSTRPAGAGRARFAGRGALGVRRGQAPGHLRPDAARGAGRGQLRRRGLARPGLRVHQGPARLPEPAGARLPSIVATRWTRRSSCNGPLAAPPRRGFRCC